MTRLLAIFLLTLPLIPSTGTAEPFLLAPLEPFEDDWRLGADIMASDGTGFLVLGDGAAQRLDSDGTPLELPKAIGLEEIGKFIDLEWTGEGYLLLYGGESPKLVSLSPEGMVSGAPVQLPFSPASVLAWSGDRGLVVGFENVEGQLAIFSAPVSRTGAVGDPRRVADVDRFSVDLVPFLGDFLMLFSVGNSVGSLRLSAAGEPIGEVQGVAVGGSPRALAATGPAGTVVAIFEETPELGRRIRVAPVRDDGSPGFGTIILDRIGDVMEIVPTVAGFLLIYETLEGGWDPRLVARPLDAAGRSIGEARELTPADTQNVIIASAGAAALIEFNGTQILVRQDATFAGGPWASGGPPSHSPPRVVFDGTRYVAAWVANTQAGSRIESVSGRTREELVGTPVIVRDSGPGVRNLAIEASPAGVLLLWTEGSALRGALRVGESWIPLPIEFSISGLGLDVAWDGESFVLVSQSRLRAAKVSPHGVVTDLGILAEQRKFPEVGTLLRPRIAAYPGGFAVVAESTMGGFSDWYETSALYVRANDDGTIVEVVRDLVPRREISSRFPDHTPSDIASRGEAPVVVAADGDRIEVLIDPGGPTASRTLIARGDAVDVRIVVVPEGYSVRWFKFGRMFSILLDPSGTPAGPIRVTEGPSVPIHEPRSTLDRWPLDVALNGDETLAVFASPTSYRGVDLFRAMGEFFSPGTIHPAPDLAAPAPASATRLEPGRWLVHWTPVPNAAQYVVEFRFERGEWFSRHTAEAHETSVEVTLPASERPTQIRVLAVTLGLTSEPAHAWPAPRRRLVRR